MPTLRPSGTRQSRLPERRRGVIHQLISLINEHLWVGHFDVWSGEDVVMFRHALLMTGGADPDGRQCEAVLKAAVTPQLLLALTFLGVLAILPVLVKHWRSRRTAST